MNKYRVLKNYGELAGRPLSDFALRIAATLRGNANFGSLPVSANQLTALANDAPSAAALIAALDFLADYVEQIAGEDLAKMQSSGFEFDTGPQSNAGLAPSAILSATNVDLGKLGLELLPSASAWAYLVEYQALPSGVKKYAMSSELNGLSLPGLTPGTVYAMRVMVLDSNIQKSEWSEVVEYLVG
jgi:hypothetical protein